MELNIKISTPRGKKMHHANLQFCIRYGPGTSSTVMKKIKNCIVNCVSDILGIEPPICTNLDPCWDNLTVEVEFPFDPCVSGSASKQIYDCITACMAQTAQESLPIIK